MRKSTLIKAIKTKKAKVGVIGLGYVGLPLSICFSQKGFQVIGFDIDEKKVNLLSNGKSYIKHINNTQIIKMNNGGFKASTSFEKISNLNVIIISVPTPLGPYNEPDLSFIHNTLSLIKPFIKENQLLVLESTTYPGTTEEEIIPIIESIPASQKLQSSSDYGEDLNLNISDTKSRFIIGDNYFIGYSPEREDPGNENFSTKTIPKVVSGYTKNCLELTKILYDQVIDKTIPVSSLKVAEMTKILENVHRAVNIGLMNELKMISNKMDINIYEVIEAAATKPFGFVPYYPGPGLGGHCIPIDPFYLSWKARQFGIDTRFIELAGEINAAMPNYVIDKAIEALNANGKSIKNSRILILGLSYKKNVDDLRESPSLVLIDILLGMGAIVDYCDPYFKTVPKTRKYQFELKAKKLNKETLKRTDLVIIATDHDVFDYDLITKEAKIIIDTRGRIRNSDKVKIA